MAAVSKNILEYVENMCINVYWIKEQSKITAKYVCLKPFVTLFHYFVWLLSVKFMTIDRLFNVRPAGLENLTGHIWPLSRSLPTPSLRNTFLATFSVVPQVTTAKSNCLAAMLPVSSSCPPSTESILPGLQLPPRQEKPVDGCWLKDG